MNRYTNKKEPANGRPSIRQKLTTYFMYPQPRRPILFPAPREWALEDTIRYGAERPPLGFGVREVRA